MADFHSIHIIFNPNSTGNAHKQARVLRRQLSRALPNMPIELLPTAHAAHGLQLAYETAKAAKRGTSPLIISASGDGGYNEVINGALRAQTEGARPICAVLPSGNANDHARTMQDKPLAESISRGNVTKLDILEIRMQHALNPVETRYAHSYIGLGLTPAIAIELNKYTLNSFKEAWIVMKTFWNLRPVVVRDEGRVVQLDSLICSTIPEMAKVLTLSDTAKADDGLFEMTKLPHSHKFRLIWRLLHGVFKDMGAESRLDSYSCTSLRPVAIQLDGEIMTLAAETELEILLRPKLLRTII